MPPSWASAICACSADTGRSANAGQAVRGRAPGSAGRPRSRPTNAAPRCAHGAKSRASSEKKPPPRCAHSSARPRPARAAPSRRTPCASSASSTRPRSIRSSVAQRTRHRVRPAPRGGARCSARRGLATGLGQVRPPVVVLVEADLRRPRGLRREEVVEQRPQSVVEGVLGVGRLSGPGIGIQSSRAAS